MYIYLFTFSNFYSLFFISSFLLFYFPLSFLFLLILYFIHFWFIFCNYYLLVGFIFLDLSSWICLLGFVCVCVCVCLFISFHRRGFSWLKQNDKCNARDQACDVVLRKLLCLKYLHRHVIDNHSRDLQAANCARVSIKPGGAMRSKRQLLELSKNQR